MKECLTAANTAKVALISTLAGVASYGLSIMPERVSAQGFVAETPIPPAVEATGTPTVGPIAPNINCPDGYIIVRNTDGSVLCYQQVRSGDPITNSNILVTTTLGFPNVDATSTPSTNIPATSTPAAPATIWPTETPIPPSGGPTRTPTTTPSATPRAVDTVTSTPTVTAVRTATGTSTPSTTPSITPSATGTAELSTATAIPSPDVIPPQTPTGVASTATPETTGTPGAEHTATATTTPEATVETNKVTLSYVCEPAKELYKVKFPSHLKVLIKMENINVGPDEVVAGEATYIPTGKKVIFLVSSPNPKIIENTEEGIFWQLLEIVKDAETSADEFVWAGEGTTRITFKKGKLEGDRFIASGVLTETLLDKTGCPEAPKDNPFPSDDRRLIFPQVYAPLVIKGVGTSRTGGW